jgi:hypothetical protein
MTWRYSVAGKEIGHPDSEHGLYVEGPLTVEDWKNILQDIIEEMVEQAKREAASDHI